MSRHTTSWKDRAAMAAIVIAILAAFSGAMLLAGAIGGSHDPTCTLDDVNAGVDRCQPQYPPELPSGTD